MGVVIAKSSGRSPIENGRKHKPKSPIDKAKGYEVVWNQVSGLFAATRPFDTSGTTFIYLIGEADDGPLKIGVSKDPIARLRTMQTGNPRRLRADEAALDTLEGALLRQRNFERVVDIVSQWGSDDSENNGEARDS